MNRNHCSTPFSEYGHEGASPKGKGPLMQALPFYSRPHDQLARHLLAHGSHAIAFGRLLNCLLDLLKSTHLDSANSLAAHTKFSGEVLQCNWIFRKASTKSA